MKAQQDIRNSVGDGFFSREGAVPAHSLGNDAGDATFAPPSFPCEAQRSLDDLESPAALLDENGTILLVNAPWQEVVPRGEHGCLSVGGNYAQFEWELALQGDAEGIRLFDGLLEIVAGISARFETIVTRSGELRNRPCRAEFSRLSNADACYVRVIFHSMAHAPSPLVRRAMASGHDGRFLTEALATLTRGFSGQTGLEIHTMFDSVSALGLAAEALLYNFVQEGLSHLHRNVDATTATLALTETDGFVHLVLWDGGSVFLGDEAGLNDVMASSGLVRIDEQLRGQGGRLTLHRVQRCTVLAASLPSNARPLS